MENAERIITFPFTPLKRNQKYSYGYAEEVDSSETENKRNLQFSTMENRAFW